MSYRGYLRPSTKRDAAEFVSLNKRRASFHRGLTAPPKTKEQFLALLTRVRKGASVCFFVCRDQDDAIVGAIMLHQIFVGTFRSPYLGYYLGAPFAKHAYITEALQPILRHAFRKI